MTRHSVDALKVANSVEQGRRLIFALGQNLSFCRVARFSKWTYEFHLTGPVNFEFQITRNNFFGIHVSYKYWDIPTLKYCFYLKYQFDGIFTVLSDKPVLPFPHFILNLTSLWNRYFPILQVRKLRFRGARGLTSGSKLLNSRI